MSKRQPEDTASALAGRDDLKRVLGDIDDAKTIDVLVLKPTLRELEEAAMWLAGDGDVLGKSGHPLGGVAAAIVEIVSAGEEDEPPEGNRT